FADGVRALWESGYRVFVEVGPSPTLVGMARRCVEGEGEGLWVASLREGREDWRTLLEGVGALYVRGVGVDWAAFDRPYGRRKVALPTYPFQRERYWLPDQPGAGARRNGAGTIGRGGAGEPVHPLLGVRLRSPLRELQFETELLASSFDFIEDHRVRGVPILPAAAYVEMAVAAAH